MGLGGMTSKHPKDAVPTELKTISKTTPKPPKRTKADTIEARNRLEDVSLMIANGKSRREIMLDCMANWGVTEHAVERYLRKARQAWLKNTEGSHKKLMAKAQMIKDNMWKQAWNAGELETGRKAHNDLCVLQGLMGRDGSQPGTQVIADNVQIVFNVGSSDVGEPPTKTTLSSPNKTLSDSKASPEGS